ncbi:ArsR family transcriptional regulator [Stutzerimonas stutzeri]|nr:ArsR family transcriptional regulator [Stutzerimonas stutzeri]
MDDLPDPSVVALQDMADHVAARLALVANAKRLLILCELAKSERPVGALQAAVGLGQSALSQHLARLREAGMVATRREGQTIHYRISDPDLDVLMQALYAAFCQPRQDAPARSDQE